LLAGRLGAFFGPAVGAERRHEVGLCHEPSFPHALEDTSIGGR
jgi:hypothetical protein